MPTSLRCWIAGSALAFSAFVLTAGSTAEQLGATAGLALLAVFLNAWIIAVGERAGQSRGGLRLRRFSLGGRLLRSYPGMQLQMMLFIVLAGVITSSWAIAGWALLTLAVLSIDGVRRAAWFIVPAAVAVHALLNMQEFTSLADLLGTAKGWMTGSLFVVLQALVVGGPLLRVDVGGRLGGFGRTLALLASLPGYAGAFWLASRTSLAGRLSALEALLFVLLAGGVVQALLLSAMSWSAALKSRDADDLSPASPRGVGMALMPMLLPALAPLLPVFVPGVGGSPLAWVGLGALLLIVPAVPAAAWVASALDRVDGRDSWLGLSVAACGLLVWLAFCPTLLGKLYAADGPAVRLHAAYPSGEAQVLAKTVELPAQDGGAPRDDMGGVTYGRELEASPRQQLLLLDLPATALARALAVLLFAAALLSVRWMRHARPLQRPTRWLEVFALAGLGGGAVWWLMPRHGLPTSVLGLAGACGVMLLVDLLHGEVRPAEPPETPDEPEEARFEIQLADISPDRGAPEIIT